MGQIQAIFIVIASMLGTGILTTTGLMAAKLGGPYEIILVWFLGGLLAITGAICYGTILNRYPISGGEAAFVQKFYYPSWGYITAILSFLVGFAASNAAASMALSMYFLAGTHINEALVEGVSKGRIIAISAILIMTSLHTQIGKHGMRIQTVLALLKFSLLLGIAIYGFLRIDWNGNPLVTATWKGASLNNWSLCLLFSVFAYSGWNAAIYSAAEFNKPAQTVPRAMLIGAIVVVGLYILLNIAILGNLSNQNLSGVDAVMVRLVQQLFGRDASQLFALLVSFVLLSSIGVSSFAGPRVLHGILFMRRVQKGANAFLPVPSKLLWLQAIISILLVLTGSFEQVMELMGVFLGIAPVMMVMGIYRKTWGITQPSTLIRVVIAPMFIVLSLAIISISLWSNSDARVFVVALLVISLCLMAIEKRGFLCAA